MDRGAAAFDAHFERVFEERWSRLRSALLNPSTHVALEDGLIRPYYVDPASRAVALLVPAERAARILDLCAAPGGKSLALFGRMAPEGHLVANERSRARRARLARVLAEHLSTRSRNRVTVTGHDARRWGLHERDAYDAVLADVPCSAERHLLGDPKELERWSRSRAPRIAATQVAILAAAVDAAVPGGSVVYATCALDPVENDAVVERVAARRSGAASVVEIPDAHPALRGVAGWERTRVGIRILPDRAAGAGPMYAALLRRSPSSGGGVDQ